VTYQFNWHSGVRVTLKLNIEDQVASDVAVTTSQRQTATNADGSSCR
jgi:hypothetical protein